MKHFTAKLVIFSLLLGFGIFFGVDMAAKGKDPGPAAVHSGVRIPVHTPAPKETPQPTATPKTPASKPAPASRATAPAAGKQPAAVPAMASIASDEEADNDSFLNRLNNKIGDALRRTAAAVFGWFVSVFNVLLE